MFMKHITRVITVSILCLFISIQGISAQNFETMDMHLAIELKSRATRPEIVNDRVLFSFSSKQPTRLVGIAFLHEDFSQIHTFLRNSGGIFVLPYTPPSSATELVYRLVVDGVWMEDPRNEDTFILNGDIPCSVFKLPASPRQEQEVPLSTVTKDGRVTFRYPADNARSVTVAGDFNHWDPYMYSLSRDPSGSGFYSLSLPLPRGTYYYYFVVDGRRVTDPANPQLTRKNDGSLVSVLNVQG